MFVGYGVSAPERGWDDFKGVSLRGKIAVFLINDPDFEAPEGEPVQGRFGGRAATYYARWTYKFEEAARQGALGALIIHEAPGAGYGWSVLQSGAGETFDVVRADPARDKVLVQGWLRREVAAGLFQRAGLDLEAMKRAARQADFKPVELPGARFSADYPLSHTRSDSHNVIGRLPGTVHPDESILYGAHWDAYGLGPADASGDRIRRGAVDDAIGVAGLVEIARAFQSGPPPERSLVFESQGRLFGVPLPHVSQVVMRGPAFSALPGQGGAMVGLMPHGPTLWPLYSAPALLLGRDALPEELLLLAEVEGRHLGLCASRVLGVFPHFSPGEAPGEFLASGLSSPVLFADFRRMFS